MAKKRLIDYIKAQLQKGYDVSAIRNVLLRYGYTDKDINDALDAIYHPTIRHEIHFGPTVIFVLVFIAIVIAGAALFIIKPPKAQSKLLDVNLEPVKTTAAAGESITFLKELSNLGSSERYDVVIKQEIINPRTFKTVTEKTETRAIETFGSTQTQINVPSDAKEGDYILRVIVEYDSKKAVATLPVKIVSSKKEDAKTETKETSCNDNNDCTEDVLQNGICVNKLITPCCGNNICEEQEQDCAADCQKPEAGLPSSPTIEEIRELAKTNPSKALQQCNQIDIPDLKDECINKIAEVQRNKNYCQLIAENRTKDLCYSNLAKILNDNSLCQQISNEGRRDACYMTFVLDNKDYSVCSKITNRQIMLSCEYLRQINELNQQAKEQQTQQHTQEQQ